MRLDCVRACEPSLCGVLIAHSSLPSPIPNILTAYNVDAMEHTQSLNNALKYDRKRLLDKIFRSSHVAVSAAPSYTFHMFF